MCTSSSIPESLAPRASASQGWQRSSCTLMSLFSTGTLNSQDKYLSGQTLNETAHHEIRGHAMPTRPTAKPPTVAATVVPATIRVFECSPYARALALIPCAVMFRSQLCSIDLLL